MTRPWQTVARVETSEGALELRQRGDSDFLITIAGRVLMTSQARRSEEALATLPLRKNPPPRLERILIGGLGMGYTLRAALDVLAATSRVTVVELNADVAAWCRGPLAPLTDGALADSRVTLVLGDVAEHLAVTAAGTYDAILFDLYEGPHAATQRGDDPLYGPTALARARAALSPGGVFAVWSEEPDVPFERRLAHAGFRVEKQRSGRGGRAHVVYLGYTLR
ncbi:MAG: spermidine synthase [Myxococcales bacterium]|nr:spermidine synthase [Myxococcales bacterium]